MITNTPNLHVFRPFAIVQIATVDPAWYKYVKEADSLCLPT
jgi:hypothetical protein